MLLLFVCSSVAISLPAFPAERIIQEWDFSKASDMLGWVNAEPVKEAKVSDGALQVVAEPARHKLESPLFDIPAKPWQYVEIELKTDDNGTGLMYYSNTTDEPYHGFRPGLYAQFGVTGDGEYHTYTIRPFWQKQGTIKHLRFDPPGKSVSIRAIRIVDMNPGEPSTATSWQFKNSSAGWQRLGSAGKLTTGGESCQIEGNRDMTLVSPALNLNSDDQLWITLRIASKTAHTALLRWASDQLDGLQSIPISLRNDGYLHSYSIDLSEVSEWTGRILALGITPSDSDTSYPIVIESVALGSAPVGPAELQITRFGLEDPVTRVGEKAKVVVEVQNTGGEPAEQISGMLTASYKLTEDAKPSSPEWTKTSTTETLFAKQIAKLAPGETARLEWELPVKTDAERVAVCRVAGPGVDAGEKQIDLRFMPKLDKTEISSLKYVPEPKPADTDGYQIGCYYFPGWHTYERWSVLDDYPERKPVLGYYQEGSPEVADWQINWAVSHGISFFIYDWYWVQGSRQLEHGLHDGYLKSRYKDKLKFCLLWANHNPPKTSSDEDLVNVTKYWIDNYFKLPNYLKVDGKNVVVIFSPGRLTEDMGQEAVKAAFAKMRKMCEDAGVGGLYLVACTYPGGHIKGLVDEGYDALSGYNYPGANTRGQQFAPYAWMVEGYKDFWSQISDAASIPYIPVCEPGWDARPWHGHKSLVRTGKSPFLWEMMLENAKAFVDDPKHKQPGDKKLVFLEAWNEFGEGDYIEPHAQFGFDYLEAVRQVFAPKSDKPQIIVPKDLGMGPYELKKPEPRTAWDFSKLDDRDWHVGNMNGFTFDGGVMRAVAGTDPAFYSPLLKVDAAKLKTLEITMRMDKGTEAQLFFSRPRGQMSEGRSIRFPVTADNQFHTYTLDLSKNPRWRGTIGQIRLDPNQDAGSTVEIQSIRFK